MKVGNIFLYFLARVSPAALTMFTQYFYTNNVSPIQYGLFSKISAIAAIAYPLVFAPIWYYLLQNKKNDGQGPGEQAYSTFLSVALIMFILALCIATFATSSLAKEFVAIVLMMILFGNIQLIFEDLRASTRPVAYLVLAFLRALSVFGFSFIFIKYQVYFFVSPMVDAMLIGILLCILPSDIMAFRKLQFKGIIESTSAIYRYGFYLSLYVVLNTALFSMDRVLIAFIDSDTNAGLYSSSYDLAMKLVHTLVFSLELSMLPMLLKVRNENLDLKEQFIVNTKIYLFIMLPIVIGLVIISPSLCDLYFPENYRQVAHFVFPVIAVSTFVAGFANAIFHHSYILSGNNFKLFQVIFTILVFNIAANSVLIYLGYPIFSSVVALISFIGYSFFTYLNTVTYCQYRFPVKFFSIVFMLCVPMIMFSMFFGFSSQIKTLIAEIFLCVILYFFGAIFFNIFNFRDKFVKVFLKF